MPTNTYARIALIVLGLFIALRFFGFFVHVALWLIGLAVVAFAVVFLYGLLFPQRPPLG